MSTSISIADVAVEQIPLKIRRCFVRAILLLTRYPQLVGKQTGTYNSPIVSSYRCDRIPDAWYETDAAIELCQLFALPNSYAQEIRNVLRPIDRKIERQQNIIEALINSFDRLQTQQDVLNLFQALFGNIPIVPDSINCLTTKMQITFIIDRHNNHLQLEIWRGLSEFDRQQVSQFLARVSDFSFKQFANFPSFNSIKIQHNLKLWRYLIEVTGYSRCEINRAIASSVNIISADKAESFLLHDIWGHYWQSMLTPFNDDYLYLSQMDEDLDLDSFVDDGNDTIYFRQLLKLRNQSISVDVPLAKQFFRCMATKRIAALLTHLISEMLADINEYKWLSQNRDRQALLNSSSSLTNFPTKLDLTVKDWDFLYLPTLESLIKLSPALEANFINHFNIENNEGVHNLRTALANLQNIFLTEYIYRDRTSIDSEHHSNSLILSLTKLQNTLNQLYTKPINNSIPFQDLILVFVGNYYSAEFERDITQIDFALENYFYPCWQLLQQSMAN